MKRVFIVALLIAAFVAFSACSATKETMKQTTETLERANEQGADTTDGATTAEKQFPPTAYADQYEEGTILAEAKAEKMPIVQANVGEDIEFSTIKLKINSVEEAQTITERSSSPTIAGAGTVFVVLNIDITNITKSEFSFDSYGFVLIDNEGRNFNPYDCIGKIDNYLEVRGLSPSIPENGNLVYLLPSDATNYYLAIIKGATSELYTILLK